MRLSTFKLKTKHYRNRIDKIMARQEKREAKEHQESIRDSAQYCLSEIEYDLLRKDAPNKSVLMSLVEPEVAQYILDYLEKEYPFYSFAYDEYTRTGPESYPTTITWEWKK